MSYQALYRKWRPDSFEDVKGQEHIVTALRNQIIHQRIGHAYLFCGTRGTGKTTVAKILAKAVNCENPDQGNPCNQCKSCELISKQNSMDVIEIDAASNNGVDNIREIREEVAYSPASGKYKVYIIDEVHMLSAGAFNALLKTLEEPPSYVIFILATTEAHKIPITILSRCQRYDFRRITIQTIADRLSELAQNEQLNIEEKAIKYLAKAADGSMRDALSLMDQCIAFYLGEELTYKKVLEVLGAVDTTIFSNLLAAILKYDILEAIGILEEVVIQGRELVQFVNDFIWHLRNLMLIQSSEALSDALELSDDSIEILKNEAKQVSYEQLIRYIRVFSELLNQLKYSNQKRVLLEVALIKLCKPTMEQSYDTILERLSLIEKQIEEGSFTARTDIQAPVIKEDDEQVVISEELPKGLAEDVKKAVAQWANICASLSPSESLMLNGAMASEGRGNQLIIYFKQDMNKCYFDDSKHKTSLEESISRYIGKHIEIVSKLLTKEETKDKVLFDPEKVNLEGVDFVMEDE